MDEQTQAWMQHGIDNEISHYLYLYMYCITCMCVLAMQSPHLVTADYDCYDCDCSGSTDNLALKSVI